LRLDAAAVVAAAVLLGLLEMRLLSLVPLQAPVEEAARKVTAILSGYPEWGRWQGRLLAPCLVRAAAALTGGGDGGGYVALVQSLFVAKDATAAILLLRLGVSPAAAFRSVLALSLATVCLVDTTAPYPWDLLDAIFLSAFLYGALRGASDRWFVLLFLVALANRESALAIPAWMVLDGAAGSGSAAAAGGGSGGAGGRRRLVAGAALLAAGAAWTLLATALFTVRETAPPLQPSFDPDHPVLTNLAFNLDFVRRRAFDLSPGLDAFKVFLPALLGALAALSWRRLDPTARRLVLVGCTFVAVVPFLGLMHEIRVYFPVLPFLVFLPHRLVSAPGPPSGEGGAPSGGD
jgi:hypothetical protein